MALNFHTEMWDASKLERFQQCEAMARLEMEVTRRHIKDALNHVPADMERAKVLISKLFGLQICTGERPAPKLKPPIACMRAGDATALLARG